VSQGAAFYCDFNAGAPVEPDVLERFLAVERDAPGNPASVHGPGRRARAVLETAREQIAAALGVAADCVLFTSGGTESANLAVHGLGDPRLPVLLSDAEHPAVMEPARARGIVPWRVDEHGEARVEDPRCAVGLICLVHAQSELGTLQPVADAAALSKRLGVPMFVDAAQALGRVPLEVALERADAVALSPHKCGGLRGHGVLVVRDAAARLRPMLRGGGQEQTLRPGTQSPALAAANALAIERAVREQPWRAAKMASARTSFLRGLRDSAAGHRVLTPLERSVSNTAMIAFSHIEGRNLLPALDLSGIHASHGSACSSGSPTPPQILMALGLAADAARACVRFSFGFRDSSDDAERAGRRAGDVVAALQKKK
jgi:cysteine desulfurase